MRWFDSDKNSLILLFSVFLLLGVFYATLTFEISDLSGAITSVIKKISDFASLVEDRLQNFESRLQGLENKLENLTNLPQKETVLPDLLNQHPKTDSYDDAQFIIDCIGFTVGVVLYVSYKWWSM
jgi:cell shape-determining protein MreC